MSGEPACLPDELFLIPIDSGGRQSPYDDERAEDRVADAHPRAARSIILASR